MIVQRKFKIKNIQGLHARPASMFVKIVNKYEAEITVKKGSESVSGKSIMGLMTLAANHGSTIEIKADGPDAEKVVEELEKFLSSDIDDEKSKSGRP